jgi:hypothetical protein
MRIRFIAFIAFLPPAALVTALILLIASSLVSTLEQRITGGDASAGFETVRYETECESLARRIEAVARDVQSCEALPGCLRSENICPVELQGELAHEYEVLRRVARDRCSDLPTHVTRVAASCSADPQPCSLEECGPPSQANSERGAPETFLF